MDGHKKDEKRMGGGGEADGKKKYSAVNYIIT